MANTVTQIVQGNTQKIADLKDRLRLNATETLVSIFRGDFALRSTECSQLARKLFTSPVFGEQEAGTLDVAICMAPHLFDPEMLEEYVRLRIREGSIEVALLLVGEFEKLEPTTMAMTAGCPTLHTIKTAHMALRVMMEGEKDILEVLDNYNFLVKERFPNAETAFQRPTAQQKPVEQSVRQNHPIPIAAVAAREKDERDYRPSSPDKTGNGHKNPKGRNKEKKPVNNIFPERLYAAFSSITPRPN